MQELLGEEIYSSDEDFSDEDSYGSGNDSDSDNDDWIVPDDEISAEESDSQDDG